MQCGLTCFFETGDTATDASSECGCLAWTWSSTHRKAFFPSILPGFAQIDFPQHLTAAQKDLIQQAFA